MERNTGWAWFGALPPTLVSQSSLLGLIRAKLSYGAIWIFIEIGGFPSRHRKSLFTFRRIVHDFGRSWGTTTIPSFLGHTYATNLLNAGAELVDIQALLGHVNLATTQIYTHVDQDRMATVVNKL